MSNKAKEIVAKMSLEEKATIVQGKNGWETQEYEKYSLKSQMLTDGPHGLRKQSKESDHLGISKSEPSTCFPSASSTACSFNRDLMYKMGEAYADKCIRENVAVILGPGVNIKRSPLCGRNFEYFSEDPFLAGEMAAAEINGVQSKGIGTSLKHFACNNQEFARMVNDSNIDERTLREIYLTAFEIAVKKSQPYTVMCSYNKINGIYSSNNKWLLTDTLRDEWGFKGLVVTDWGAMADPVLGIKAGCDLEMPFCGKENTNKLIEAVKEGRLQEDELNKCAERVVDLILQGQKEKHSTSNDKKDHELAKEVALESAVLLKNENNILPLKNGEEVLIIGDMAKNPRYQGAGSSKMVPTRIDNIIQSAIKEHKKIKYISGYEGTKLNEELLEKAVNAAKKFEKVVIVAGLPDEFEGEGYDRSTFMMPISHTKLIEEVSKVNKNVIVVLECGAPCDISWKEKVKGLLLVYLQGQAGGGACVDLLWGKVNPSAKLAETWPIKLEDCPASLYFRGKVKAVEYREGIYVGYRYYNTVNMDVNYPFGYGLSYTTFAYDNLKINSNNDDIKVSVDVTNTGEVFGKEIVQLYISKNETKVIRPVSELKEFVKVSLKPHETKTVTFNLTKEAFRYYNEIARQFCYEGGKYQILIGKSSRDIILKDEITIKGDGKEILLLSRNNKLSDYRNPSVPFKATDEQFELLLGHNPSEGKLDRKGHFSEYSCLEDFKTTLFGRIVVAYLMVNPTKIMEKNADEGMKKHAKEMLMTMPLKAILMSGKITKKQINAFILMANGHLIKGLKLLKGE